MIESRRAGRGLPRFPAVGKRCFTDVFGRQDLDFAGLRRVISSFPLGWIDYNSVFCLMQIDVGLSRRARSRA